MIIVDQTYDPAIPVDTLEEHPDNPRRGDDDAVTESIVTNGFFGAILVQKSTGHVIAGNTRFRAMRDAGEDAIPGFWVDCDDDAAKRILLADNRTSDLAYYADDALLELLREVHSTPLGLTGTGYDDASYSLLIDQLTGTGASTSPDIPSHVEDLRASDVRSLVLPYPQDEFDIVVAKLRDLREDLDLDTNQAVIFKLLSEA